ncbi:MAG: S1 RNA-binding domain-containing protein [Candidatus Daviesbacteria bacterium]|nr:S1 RNA-binding domain-containing protein [Candidatus Daviesbacteria bacterium]
MVQKNISKNPTMEELLASQPKSPTLYRGQEVEGEIISITDKEIIFDLGAKSDGILLKKEFPQANLSDLKVGKKFTAFIASLDNGSGQVVLSTSFQSSQKTGKRRKTSFDKFTQAQKSDHELTGQVVEINKGGLIVEIGGVRGFLPNSQVGSELLIKTFTTSDLVGQEVRFKVIEVDEDNMRLIFSQKLTLSKELEEKLQKFKQGDKVTGKISAILNFGLVVDVDGVAGLVFISDVAWEKVEDLSKLYQVGQEIEAQIQNIDLELGKLDLSLKHLSEDPFIKVSEKYHADDSVKAEVVSIDEYGVKFNLEEGVEGFLPSSKMDPGTIYETGQKLTMLVDSIDKNHRKINLAPMVTSTAGLIYK